MNFPLDKDGWELISAEDRNTTHPDTFQIPAREKRESLTPGDEQSYCLRSKREKRDESRIAGLTECG
jgi:hypothetical protein